MSRFLLDTHAFLWLATDDDKLTPCVRQLYTDLAHDWFLSIASVWELAIKVSLGKLSLSLSLSRLVRGGVERGLKLLAIDSHHALAVEHLPYHHRDPFDRMLVAQAAHEGLGLVSCDPQLDAYPIARVWE